MRGIKVLLIVNGGIYILNPSELYYVCCTVFTSFPGRFL